MFVFVILLQVIESLNAACPSLRSPENGFMYSTDRSNCGTEISSVCKLSCNPNYRISGNSEVICQSNGEWSGKQGTCVDPTIRCLPQLIAPRHGFIDGECVNWGGFVCTFGCDEGYVISGSVRVKCERESRRWSNPSPTCVRDVVTCPALEEPENGELSGDCDGISSVVGTRCRFSCGDGYELRGSSTLQCLSTGQWNALVPTCVEEIMTCRPLRSPTNGYKTGVCDDSPPKGSRCVFHCNSGYTLHGQSILVCTSSGNWNGAIPSCVRRVITCPHLTTPENGGFRCNQGTNVGSRCAFSCNSGYEIDGQKTLICQSNGTWNGEEPSCKESAPTCSALEGPQYGRKEGSCNEGTPVGATCRFYCNSGYELRGNQRLVCQPDGTWDNEEPVCVRQVVKCPMLNAPKNGSLKGQCASSDAPVGSNCVFSCNTGFTLKGEPTLACLSTGKWNNTSPICILIVSHCPVLRSPENGEIFGACGRESVSGSQCTFSCNSGYKIQGSSVLTCLPKGTWDRMAPTCIQEEQEPTCSALDAPEHGSKAGACFEGARVGATCAFRCEEGYELSGKENLVCQVNGNWDEEAPECQEQPKGCKTLHNPVGGKATGDCNPGVDKGLCAFSCHRGYYLIGTPVLLCKDGNWSSRPPICRRNPRGGCGLPFVPTGAIISYCSTLVGGRCYFACRYSSLQNRRVDNMRNVNSLPRDIYSVCQPNGLWRGRLISCRPGISWILGFPVG